MVFVVAFAAVLTERKMTLHSAEWSTAHPFTFTLFTQQQGTCRLDRGPERGRKKRRIQKDDRGKGGRE